MENKIMESTKNKKKLGDILKDEIQKIIIIIVSIIYILQGVFSLETKETTVLDILGNIGLSIIIGITIANCLRGMGIKDGRNDEAFIASMKAYGMAKERATQYFDKLSSWCHYKNEQELEFKKRDIIQSCGLSWKGFKSGYYDKHLDKLTEEQQKALEQAKKCRIAKLVSEELLSDFPKCDKRNINQKFGETQNDYKRRDAVTDGFTRIFTGVISGLYVLQPILNAETLANILWHTVQITIWLTIGVIKYYNAKSFMLDEYRQSHIILKTEYLNEFVVTMEKDPDVIKTYLNEDDDIDGYIEKLIREKENKLNEQERILD